VKRALPWALVGFVVVVLGMSLGIAFHSPSPQARVASIAKATEAGGTIWLTATSRSLQFCTSIKPSVEASQQLKPLLARMSSDTVAKTKSELLTEINTVLDALHSVKTQVGSAPANVRGSFKWDVLAAGKVKRALGHATTKRQIRAAVGQIVGSHPKERPLITYILAQCEGPAPSGVPATQ
jgi:hypothetical protein